MGDDRYFTDDVGHRWYRDADGAVHPEKEGGYTLECGCTITEPMRTIPARDIAVIEAEIRRAVTPALRSEDV